MSIFILALPSQSNYREKNMMTRRQSLRRIVGAAAATIAAPMLNRGWFQLFAQTTSQYSARAMEPMFPEPRGLTKTMRILDSMTMLLLNFAAG